MKCIVSHDKNIDTIRNDINIRGADISIDQFLNRKLINSNVASGRF
jgi:hypothetical protein